jgi:hypothetical protein
MAANGGMVGRRLAEGSLPTLRAPHRTIRALGGVPPAEGRGRPCAILSPLFGAPLSELVQRTSPGDSMPEILTESFCERCGTRYTFESASPRGPRLKGLKVMSRGLKNFVLSDDTSMDEAMAAARNETDREQTAQQLDAFHKTFNFCMSCRQYTCGNCWNEAEGRCLSCAPHLGHEVLPAPFGNVGAGGAVTLTGSEAIGLHDRNGNGAEAAATAEPMAWPEAEHMAWPEPEPMAWPTSDLTRDESAADGPETFQEVIDAAARLEAVAGAAEREQAVEVEPAVDEVAADIDEVAAEVAPLEAAIEAEPEHIEPIAPEVEFVPAPAPPIETAPSAPAGDQLDDLAAVAAANTSDLLHRFRPGDDIDEQIAAYERDKSAAASAAMAAAAEAAAAEADAAEAAASRAAAEAADVEARAAAQAAEAEARAAADAEARAAAVAAEQATRAAAEAEARAAAQAAEAEARATADAQAREAAAAAEAAAQAAAAEAAAQAAAAEPRDDVVYQPTWQIVAPEPPAADQPLAPQQPPFPPSPSAAEPIAASAEPEWPSQPEWPRPPSATGLPFLGRPPAASGGIEALWAESAREVTSTGPVAGAKPAGGVQPCVSCGLSLSANARFCRRCGTRQG